MIKVSAKQMASLAVSMGSHFENRLVAYIQAQFPDQVPLIEADRKRGGLPGFVRTYIEHADRFGLDDDADCAVYIALVLGNARLGAAKAEVLAWTRELLQREKTPGPLKIEWLLARLADQSRAKADAGVVLGWLRHAESAFAT